MNKTVQTPREQQAVENANRPVRYATPPANITQTKDGYLLEAEMPGVSKEGLSVTVENNELVILGRRGEPKIDGDLYYRESQPVDFRRAFDLDPSIDSSKITASIEQGLLKVNLPKAEVLKPRKITVS